MALPLFDCDGDVAVRARMILSQESDRPVFTPHMWTRSGSFWSSSTVKPLAFAPSPDDALLPSDIIGFIGHTPQRVRYVRLRIADNCGMVLEPGQSGVAVPADQATDFPGVVAVVDEEPFTQLLDGPAADFALAFLLRDHGLVLGDGEAVLAEVVVQVQQRLAGSAVFPDLAGGRDECRRGEELPALGAHLQCAHWPASMSGEACSSSAARDSRVGVAGGEL